MLKIDKIETYGWEAAIRGMRNPMNSWDKSDSYEGCLTKDMFDIFQENGDIPNEAVYTEDFIKSGCRYVIGDNDLDLMKRLSKAGTDHRKFMRMITVSLDITAPLYWWKEFDTYKVGTVANSCSTMHKIAAKEFTLDDFSMEHLDDHILEGVMPAGNPLFGLGSPEYDITTSEIGEIVISALNKCREEYLRTKHKKYWWQMIQLLPSSYNQKRTVMLNYEVLANMYRSRKDHKLDEWRDFCNWIETLAYSEIITGKKKS